MRLRKSFFIIFFICFAISSNAQNNPLSLGSTLDTTENSDYKNQLDKISILNNIIENDSLTADYVTEQDSIADVQGNYKYGANEDQETVLQDSLHLGRKRLDYKDGVFDEEEGYSLLEDFRVPTRHNLSRSLLLKEGWKTDSNMYIYRCENGKRVRITYWYYESKNPLTNGSTFFNITEGHEDCKEGDDDYRDPTRF